MTPLKVNSNQRPYIEDNPELLHIFNQIVERHVLKLLSLLLQRRTDDSKYVCENSGVFLAFVIFGAPELKALMGEAAVGLCVICSGLYLGSVLCIS